MRAKRENLTPEHPAVLRVARAICELLGAIEDLRELRASPPGPGKVSQSMWPEGTPALLTVPQAAKLLAIGTNRLYGLVKAGTVPSVQIGRRYLIPAGKLEEWVGRATVD